MNKPLQIFHWPISKKIIWLNKYNWKFIHLYLLSLIQQDQMWRNSDRETVLHQYSKLICLEKSIFKTLDFIWAQISITGIDGKYETISTHQSLYSHENYIQWMINGRKLVTMSLTSFFNFLFSARHHSLRKKKKEGKKMVQILLWVAINRF